jgi:hypothetical protein
VGGLLRGGRGPLQVETLRKHAKVLEGHNLQLQQQLAQLAKDNRGMQVRKRWGLHQHWGHEGGVARRGGWGGGGARKPRNQPVLLGRPGYLAASVPS